jgi:bifunctional DNA-binding transcriptional regulator/antitoxin component of YhaV-PrlF toxin-antitoxin module
MGSIKLTSKRQATFPVEVCRQMGVGPGDSLFIEAMGEGAEQVWVLKPAKEVRPAWFGRLKRYVGNANEPWERERHGEATGRAMAERLKRS